MDRNVNITKQLHEELKKLTTAVSFDTWLKPLEVHHLDHDLKIAYLGIRKTKGIDINFILKIVRNRYLTVVEDCLQPVLGEKYRVIAKDMDEYRE